MVWTLNKPWQKRERKNWHCDFPVHDCTLEENGSPYFSSVVRQCKWPSLSRKNIEIRKFCYNQLQKYWDTVPYFGLNGLSMILCSWPPLHPFSKLLAIQDHAQNLEEQLWMGGRREVSIISHRPVTRSDLKQERLFFRESVSTFLQLVVA